MYREKSWIDPRLELRDSSVEGMGVFAREPIKKGEVMNIWGGSLFSSKEIEQQGRECGQTTCQIDEALWIANPVDAQPDLDDYFNHSCDPNVWMGDEVTVVARRDISAGEELTADYGMWVATPGLVLIEPCRCGSPDCRGCIIGDDWKRPELWERYGSHVPPYLFRRIEHLRKEMRGGS